MDTSPTSFATITPTEAETVVLIANLLQAQLDLPAGRGTIYNQPFEIPADDRLCYSVGILGDRPYGQRKTHEVDPEFGLVEVIGQQVQEMIEIVIFSKGPEARMRRPEVPMLLKSDQAQQIQEKYSFQIGTIPVSMVDTSRVDGARRINRYSIAINVLRAYERRRLVESYNLPNGPELLINP